MDDDAHRFADTVGKRAAWTVLEYQPLRYQGLAGVGSRIVGSTRP